MFSNIFELLKVLLKGFSRLQLLITIGIRKKWNTAVGLDNLLWIRIRLSIHRRGCTAPSAARPLSG